MRVISGTEDRFVSEGSAKSYYGEVDWHPLTFGHIDLVKPATRTDVRYQRAREFLEECRSVKSEAVLKKVWKASRDIWQSHKGKLIRNWRFNVIIDGQDQTGLDEALVATGFSISKVESSYKTIMDSTDVLIGISYGKIASKKLWEGTGTGDEKRQPAYLHSLYFDAHSPEEKKAITLALDAVISFKDPDVKWKTLFPNIQVSIVLNDAKEITLVGCGYTSPSGALLRSFTLPQEHHDLLGEEVDLVIRYSSVRPKSSPAFRIVYPWLTQGCSCEVQVSGDMEYFVATTHLVGGGKLESEVEDQGAYRKMLAATDDLILPGSTIDLRWRLKQA